MYNASIQNSGKIMNDRFSAGQNTIQKCYVLTEEKLDDDVQLGTGPRKIFIVWLFRVGFPNPYLHWKQNLQQYINIKLDV
jgi:hypothetical protein